MFLEKEGKLIYSYDGETVCIEAWGKDALRVRATKNRALPAVTGRWKQRTRMRERLKSLRIHQQKAEPLPICMRERILPTEKSQMEASCSDRFRQRHYVLS